MVSTSAKVHLRHKGGVACKRRPVPRKRTSDPAEVTCGDCKKTIHMADAEIQSRVPARKH